MEGEVWTGRFDFTLLRPVNTQFLASFAHWRLFALFDLVLGLGVLGAGGRSASGQPSAPAMAGLSCLAAGRRRG